MPLDIRRAVVASTNPAKVAAVEAALARVAPGCELVAHAAESGVGAQPIGDERTRDGALRRARSSLAAIGADIAFGLEGGVIFEGDAAHLVSWAVALAPDGTSGAASARMPLPARVTRPLREGVELGVIVDGLFGVQESKTHSGAIGLLTEGALSRTDAFTQLVLMALAPHLHWGLYHQEGTDR